MVKINSKRKLKVYFKDYDSGSISQELVAKYLCITPRRFRQIHKMYRSTGFIPAIGVNLGRPKKEVPEEWKEIIKQEYDMFRQNALYQENTIYARCKIRIPHNTLHKVMLEFGFAKEQESKQKRRKPWIRYEREHSLSAVHLDWHTGKVVKKEVYVVERMTVQDIFWMEESSMQRPLRSASISFRMFWIAIPESER